LKHIARRRSYDVGRAWGADLRRRIVQNDRGLTASLDFGVSVNPLQKANASPAMTCR
jgi:hypothetical protein